MFENVEPSEARWREESMEGPQFPLQSLQQKAIAAFRLGSQLGALSNNTPSRFFLPWEEIQKKFSSRLKISVEKDVIDCFEKFCDAYSWAGDEEDFLTSWASYHAENRRATSYTKIWQDYFQMVRWLGHAGTLKTKILHSIHKEREQGDSTCLALVLPAYRFATRVGLPKAQRNQLIVSVVRLSHPAPATLAITKFLCWYIDYLSDPASTPRVDPLQFEDSPELLRFLVPEIGVAWRHVEPVQFFRLFRPRPCCESVLVHALYGVERAKSVQDLIVHFLNLPRAFSPVLALGLMLWVLHHPEVNMDVLLPDLQAAQPLGAGINLDEKFGTSEV